MLRSCDPTVSSLMVVIGHTFQELFALGWRAWLQSSSAFGPWLLKPGIFEGKHPSVGVSKDFNRSASHLTMSGCKFAAEVLRFQVRFVEPGCWILVKSNSGGLAQLHPALGRSAWLSCARFKPFESTIPFWAKKEFWESWEVSRFWAVCATTAAFAYV